MKKLSLKRCMGPGGKLDQEPGQRIIKGVEWKEGRSRVCGVRNRPKIRS